ncbi:M24 family metallopeptidase [Sphingomonas oryzagri]|uniref:Xaa-Pro peptidase family protein n=1 Tax=Sphingomonas oryzagri TaxID=3042314 RepID=A0ABT6MYX1_9SPHN|nr:Xaa-Pro peptidase family protein [Sphingomonas oryzagri]MDH7637991.1 Xaa-Pro peptidase family protein [Sphingomonas oryzagri]
MISDRRTLLTGILAAGATLALPQRLLAATGTPLPAPPAYTPPAITQAERERRIEEARRRMRAAGISALLIEPGSSLIYFTGIEWHRSERLTCAVIPANGDIAIVMPFFEEPSIRLSLAIPAEVRIWNEDEDPLVTVAGILKDRKAAAGPIAIEETMRYFAVDGLKKALPNAAIVSGAGVVRGCRMHKSPAEIALMRHATDITIAAYRWLVPQVAPGMKASAVSSMMDAATRAMGGSPEFSMVLVDAAAALPHGVREDQTIGENSLVLMDCGCTVEGYQSDVSRTFVVGRPSDHQRQVWDQVHRGQQVAFAAAKIGAAAASVDDAVRRFYEGLGYGPGYRLPGLSHRTGHGIGLDGHEPVNLVHGETQVLEPGMCFSDEPGLYLPGQFGVRLEDCFHMTEAGPAWFSQPPESLERPV